MPPRTGNRPDKRCGNRVKQENKTIRGHTQRSGSKQLEIMSCYRVARLL